MLTSTSLSGWNIRPCLCACDWVTSTIRCVSCRHPVSLFTHVMDWWVSQRQNGFQKFDTTPQLRSSAKIFSSVSGYTQPWGVFCMLFWPQVSDYWNLQSDWLSVLTCIHTNILQFPVGGQLLKTGQSDLVKARYSKWILKNIYVYIFKSYMILAWKRGQ